MIVGTVLFFIAAWAVAYTVYRIDRWLSRPVDPQHPPEFLGHGWGGIQ